jgi:hypothetical protein
MQISTPFVLCTAYDVGSLWTTASATVPHLVHHQRHVIEDVVEGRGALRDHTKLNLACAAARRHQVQAGKWDSRVGGRGCDAEHGECT